MAQRIFVAHAHEDRSMVQAAEQALRQHGVLTPQDTIMDHPEQAVQGGENIREAIKDQISSASMVVIILSENSESSGWVNYEAGMAAALDKPIILVGRGSEKRHVLANSLGDLGNVRFIEIEEKR